MHQLQIHPLSTTASNEQIVSNINKFKIQALNFATNSITDKDAKHLEPREIKTLVDIVLNLEDSIQVEDTEGKLVRKAQRLLEKYGSNSTIQEAKVYVQ